MDDGEPATPRRRRIYGEYAIKQEAARAGLVEPIDPTDVAAIRKVYAADGIAWVKCRTNAPQDLSALGQEAIDARVAVDRHGNATAIWTRASLSRYVQAATRPATGGNVKDGWSQPQDISPLEQSVRDPQLAVGPNGDAVAVWGRFEGVANASARYVVEAATRSGGVWRRQDVSAPPAQTALPPRPLPEPAVDAQGNAALVWSSSGAGGPAPTQAVGYDAAGPWLRGLSVPATGTVGSPLAFSVSPLMSGLARCRVKRAGTSATARPPGTQPPPTPTPPRAPIRSR